MNCVRRAAISREAISRKLREPAAVLAPRVRCRSLPSIPSRSLRFLNLRCAAAILSASSAALDSRTKNCLLAAVAPLISLSWPPRSFNSLQSSRASASLAFPFSARCVTLARNIPDVRPAQALRRAPACSPHGQTTVRPRARATRRSFVDAFEQRRADADDRGPLFDRHFVIATHAHR